MLRVRLTTHCTLAAYAIATAAKNCFGHWYYQDHPQRDYVIHASKWSLTASLGRWMLCVPRFICEDRFVVEFGQVAGTMYRRKDIRLPITGGVMILRNFILTNFTSNTISGRVAVLTDAIFCVAESNYIPHPTSPTQPCEPSR